MAIIAAAAAMSNQSHSESSQGLASEQIAAMYMYMSQQSLGHQSGSGAASVLQEQANRKYGGVESSEPTNFDPIVKKHKNDQVIGRVSRYRS